MHACQVRIDQKVWNYPILTSEFENSLSPRLTFAVPERVPASNVCRNLVVKVRGFNLRFFRFIVVMVSLAIMCRVRLVPLNSVHDLCTAVGPVLLLRWIYTATQCSHEQIIAIAIDAPNNIVLLTAEW